MSEILSYLWAQARRQPLDTLRFAASEVWRRGRLRWVDSLDRNLPQFSQELHGKAFAAFLPSAALERQQLSNLPFAAAAIETGEQVCRHEFEIFGERVALGAQIDWHRDWKTGFAWPLERPSGLSVLESHAAAPPGTDSKRPWELGRFHHALALGQAFVLTGDRKFSDEFSAQVHHWIQRNPYPRGLHWAMPMEAAVRAVNLATAAALFEVGGGIDPAFHADLLRSLFLHGRHLAAHREWNPVARANHYVACIAGLLHLGALFEETPEGRDWLAFARREIFSEMTILVGDDGVAREGSSGYHCFVAEMFLSCALLLARLDRQPMNDASKVRTAIQQICGPQFAAQLERMFHFIATLCEGRQRPPVWGDADDGRLLPFGGCAEGAVIPLAGVGAALYGYACPPAGKTAAPEVFWRLAALPQCSASPHETTKTDAFPAAGFFFFRSQRLRGSIRCGPLGAHGWTNHAHCDQLSVEFCCDGRPVVVDPGLPCYAQDPAARNLFRSTHYHNVAVVAGEEQNRFWPRLLFRIVDDTRAQLLQWDVSPAGVQFSGEHFGYERLDVQAKVGRELQLDARHEVLTLFDNISLRAPAQVEWLFHLAPGIEPKPLDEAAVPPANPRHGAALAWDCAWQLGPVVLRVWTSLDPQSFVARREEGWVAPRFGQKIPAQVLSFSGTARGSVAAAFEFSVRGEGAAAQEASA